MIQQLTVKSYPNLQQCSQRTKHLPILYRISAEEFTTSGLPQASISLTWQWKYLNASRMRMKP